MLGLGVQGQEGEVNGKVNSDLSMMSPFPGKVYCRATVFYFGCILEPAGGFKNPSAWGPTPKDSHVIGLGCGQKVGSFRSSPDDFNAQPSLRATVLKEETDQEVADFIVLC